MQLFFSRFVTDSVWEGGNTPWPLFWKKPWIWPLMVFYKLNLALEMYLGGHRCFNEFSLA
jgi:hypothetical protein